MKLGNEIKKILKADRGTLTVRVLFADGVRADIDLGFIFAKPRGMASELVRGGALEKCFIEHGALACPGVPRRPQNDDHPQEAARLGDARARQANQSGAAQVIAAASVESRVSTANAAPHGSVCACARCR